MLPRANPPSLTPPLRMSNLMSAGAHSGENHKSQQQATCAWAGTSHTVCWEPTSVCQESPWAANQLRDTDGPPEEFQKKQTGKFMCNTLGLFHTFFPQHSFGVYLFTFLLGSEESMRVLEVFREQLTHLQIMQVSGCSWLNINRINNVFQQRLGLT